MRSSKSAVQIGFIQRHGGYGFVLVGRIVHGCPRHFELVGTRQGPPVLFTPRFDQTVRYSELHNFKSYLRIVFRLFAWFFVFPIVLVSSFLCNSQHMMIVSLGMVVAGVRSNMRREGMRRTASSLQ